MYLNWGDLIVLSGFFLTGILALSVGLRSKSHFANVWLFAFLVVSAIVLNVKFLYSSGYIVNYPHWFKVNQSLGILRPVFIYLYVYYLLRVSDSFSRKHLLHFVPFFLVLAYQLPFYLQSKSYKLDVLNREIVNSLGVLPPWFNLFQIGYSITYLGLTIITVRSFSKEYPNPGIRQKKMIRWVKVFVIGGTIYLFIVTVFKVLGLTQNFNYYMYEIFSIGMILLCIRFLTWPDTLKQIRPEKYGNSPLSKVEIDNYFDRIVKLMEEEKLFRKNDLKLKDIADQIQVSEYLVSQIVNQKTSQPFRKFVNVYRISLAKKMLNQKELSFSIEGIANEVGFNSKTSFYSAFKEETKLTPTQYLNHLK